MSTEKVDTSTPNFFPRKRKPAILFELDILAYDDHITPLISYKITEILPFIQIRSGQTIIIYSGEQFMPKTSLLCKEGWEFVYDFHCLFAFRVLCGTKHHQGEREGSAAKVSWVPTIKVTRTRCLPGATPEYCQPQITTSLLRTITIIYWSSSKRCIGQCTSNHTITIRQTITSMRRRFTIWFHIFGYQYNPKFLISKYQSNFLIYRIRFFYIKNSIFLYKKLI